MKILCSTSYYYPHISGLTVVSQTIAEELAARGHTVTVLTSRHDPLLPVKEVLKGVNVVRVPVLCRIGKGPVMPSYLRHAGSLMPAHDVVLAHLPASPLEVAAFSFPAGVLNARPTVVVYHCDLRLPPMGWNRLVNAGVFVSNSWMALCADGIVASSEDYAHQSNFLRRFLHKTAFISPPVAIPEPRPANVAALRSRYAFNGEFLIGFVGRWATEKGLDCLLAALPYIRKEIPNTKVLCAGETHAIGEQRYRDFLQSRFAEEGECWELLGRLGKQELAEFYAACDVIVLPSVNATESFGLVQVESMLCGTPVVATDLPGVRIPIKTAGMGQLVPPRDEMALADAIRKVIQNRHLYIQPREAIERHFSLKTTMDCYEALLERFVGNPPMNSRTNPPSFISTDSGESASRRGLTQNLSVDVLQKYLDASTPFHALVRSSEYRLLRRAGAFDPPILDLGCGDGYFGSLLFTERPLAGIDPDFSSCREARILEAHKHVIAANAAAMPFPNAYFQTVVANCVLEHVIEIDAALGEIFRVIRPGGRLLFGVPSHCFGEMLYFSTQLNKIGLKRSARAYARWFNHHSRHFHTDSPAVWTVRLAYHGFRVEGWEYYLTAAGLRAFDLAHYLSLPHLVSRKLSGRWVTFPIRLASPLFERWLRPHSEALPVKEGPYIFFRARKTDEHMH